MTTKTDFLNNLRSALYERGVSDIDAAPYLERFDRFYDRMAEDSAQTAVLDDIDTIADNISAQISESYGDINKLAYRATAEEDYDDSESDEPILETEELLPENSDKPEISDEPEISEEYLSVEQIGKKLPDYKQDENIPNSTIFWVLFGVCSPLWIPLVLLGLSLFLAAFIGLAAIMAASIISIIAIVAAGSAAALVGLIYGIMQLFTSVATGVYEIGLAVIIVGIVMLTSILLYNFAVRVVPILFRLMRRFFSYSVKKLKLFFNFLRRECAKI